MDPLTITTACTLPTAERPTRLAEFDALFAESVRSVEHGEGTAVLRLSGAAGLRERVLDLTARETACCSFFTFAVTGTDDDLLLAVSAPPQRHDLLGALVGRAEAGIR
jgi:hypothetical protein